jgi:hypothetical protein
MCYLKVDALTSIPAGSAGINTVVVKFAVVIPTRNEARTIAAVVAAADAGLAALGSGALIVNADGGSDDGTSAAFLATPTRTPKRLLTIEGPPGKGRNLLAAWRFCLAEDVDAVVTLDGDMTTVQPWWIGSFLRPIGDCGAEFVSPLYRRSMYRSVAARSVSRAFLYAWFGVDVQHPLSGNAALARPLLQRLASRDWTPAELRYGVEMAVVSTVLADGRPWARAQLDICMDKIRFGHRTQIMRDVLTATVEAAREFVPRLGPGGPAVTAPMTFTEESAPETAWLEEGIARTRDGSAACWQDYARWQGDRIGEIEAAIEAGWIDASVWFHVFVRALLEARGLGRARPAAHYATALAPLVCLRVLTVWREIEGLPAEAIDAAAAAEVAVMRAALMAAEGWVGSNDAAAESRERRRQSTTS